MGAAPPFSPDLERYEPVRPRVVASRIRSARDAAPALVSRLATCFSTVRGDRYRRSAMSRLGSRSPTRARTSASRAVTPSRRRSGWTAASTRRCRDPPVRRSRARHAVATGSWPAVGLIARVGDHRDTSSLRATKRNRPMSRRHTGPDTDQTPPSQYLWRCSRRGRAGACEHSAHDQLRDRHLDVAGRRTVGKVKDADDELHRVVRRLVHRLYQHLIDEELDAAWLPVDRVTMIDADIDRVAVGRERLHQLWVAEGVDSAPERGHRSPVLAGSDRVTEDLDHADLPAPARFVLQTHHPGREHRALSDRHPALHLYIAVVRGEAP